MMIKRLLLAVGMWLVIASPSLALTRDEEPCAKVKSSEFKSCVITRDYLTTAKKILARKLDAEKMPDKPAALDEKFLTPKEVDLVNRAVSLALFKLLEQDSKKNIHR